MPATHDIEFKFKSLYRPNVKALLLIDKEEIPEFVRYVGLLFRHEGGNVYTEFVPANIDIVTQADGHPHRPTLRDRRRP